MLILTALTLIALLGMLALVPLGLRLGDRPGDIRLVEIQASAEPRGARVTLTNPERTPVLIGISLRRAGARLRFEGASYVRIRTRSTASDLLARAQTAIAVLRAGETATFLVAAGPHLPERAELVAVIGQPERLRTIHRLVRLPLQSPLRRKESSDRADTVARCRPTSGSGLHAWSDCSDPSAAGAYSPQRSPASACSRSRPSARAT